MSTNEIEARLKKVTENIAGLPTLPKVVTEITNMMQNPRTSAEDVGRAITMDQSLASKVLKLVNSAFYGFPGRINTITHAIVILGFNTVKNIVLTASVFDKFGGKSKSDDFDLEKFWLHSIAVGVIAKEVAKKVNVRFFEECFLAGLLHDIGKVILVKFLNEDFAEVVKYRNENNSLFLDAEKATIKITHNEIGGWLAQKWNLPDDLKSVILHHHTPGLATAHSEMVSIIHVADILARALDIGSGGDNKIPVMNSIIWDKLKFSRQLIEKIYNDIEIELEKATIFLQLL